jgi:hypothetical protein
MANLTFFNDGSVFWNLKTRYQVWMANLTFLNDGFVVWNLKTRYQVWMANFTFSAMTLSSGTSRLATR